MSTPTGLPAYGAPETPIDPKIAQPGDTFVINDTRYRVEGVVTCVEDGYRWTEFAIRATAGEEPELQYVGYDDGKWTLWTDLEDADLAPDGTIRYNGTVYVLDDDGRATYTSVGDTDVAEHGVVDYRDYKVRGDKSQRLSLERWDAPEGTSWEASLGEHIAGGAITAYRPLS